MCQICLPEANTVHTKFAGDARLEDGKLSEIPKVTRRNVSGSHSQSRASDVQRPKCQASGQQQPPTAFRITGTVNANCGDHAVAQLVEALRYKPEGRGFDSR